MFSKNRKINVLVVVNGVLVLLVVAVLIYIGISSSKNPSPPDVPPEVRTVQRKIKTLDVGGQIYDLDRLPEGEIVYFLGRDTSVETTLQSLGSQIYILNARKFALEGQVKLQTADQKFIRANRLILSHQVPEMYVSTRGGKVLRVSTNNFQIQAQATVRGMPTEMVIDPTGEYLFVVNQALALVDVIRLADFQVVKTLRVGRKPTGIMIDQSGDLVYVANAESGTLSVISTSNLSVVGSILVGGRPVEVLVYPDQDLVLVLDQDNHQLVVIDQRSNQMVGQIQVVGSPTEMVLDLSKNKLYVLGEGQKGVGVVDLNKEEMTELILLGSAFEKGESLNNIDLSEDGGKLIITDGGWGKVYEISIK